MNVEGTVVSAPFGPGAWLLETEDGARYALLSQDEALLREGQRVIVAGALRDDAVGFGMTGDPVLAVERWKPQG